MSGAEAIYEGEVEYASQRIFRGGKKFVYCKYFVTVSHWVSFTSQSLCFDAVTQCQSTRVSHSSLTTLSGQTALSRDQIFKKCKIM